MYFKDFDKWNSVKKALEEENQKVHIRIGEIRWVSLGVNVGSEIDGKGDSFTRPVLILHVIGRSLALVVPMSTKVKDMAGYQTFHWKGKDVSICIHQLKIISQKRIFRRQGKIPNNRFNDIKGLVKEFYNF